MTRALEAVDLRARAEPFLEKVAVGAADRERNRELPYELIRELALGGLGAWRVPRDQGGPGASIRDTFVFLLALATADANIAQAVRPHFGFVESLIRSSSEVDRRRWFPRVLNGDLFGLANGEVGAANGVIRTRLSPDGDGWRLNGSKFYSTGCLFADWLSVSAVDDTGERVFLVVPSAREGVGLVDDWDGFGQRLTASGTTTFTDVAVDAADLLDRPAIDGGPRSHVTAFQQLLLGAVNAGIARNALTDAVDFARNRARPIKHSTAQRSIDDPYVRHAVGEMSARAFAAESAVLRAAESIDRALDAGGPADLLDVAAVEVAQAQFLAAESALRSAELLFDVGGGSTTLREHNFDRHWRNARTVTNHNPRAWKAAVIGDFRLNGTSPPSTGLF